MHAGVLGQAGIFGVLDDSQVQLGTELKSLSHERVIEYGLTIIRNCDCTRAMQAAKVC